MRISIVGHSGSGKTTLAKKISGKLSIPHIQLDRFWFEAGGLKIMNKKTPEYQSEHERVRAYVKENILKTISADSWVSDGFYSRFQSEISDRADVIIYLDIPLWRRLANHASRVLFSDDRHKEVSLWNEFTFFFEIIRRSTAFKPKFDKFLPQYKDKIITLHSRKEIRSYIQNLIS